MEKFEIFLFLLGITSAAVIVLLFSIPLFFFGIYKNVKETKKLVEELIREVRVMNYLNGDKTEEDPSPILEENKDVGKLHEIFLDLATDKPTDMEIEMEDK